MSRQVPQAEIDTFLRSGQYDLLFLKFPGSDHFDRISRGHRALADALAVEVQQRESALNAKVPNGLPADSRAFMRGKVEPMVRGLFRRSECEAVLALLENSLVFLTCDNVARLIREERLDSAWEIANAYLRSIGANPISSEAPNIVGLSVDAKCYVSLEYFRDDNPFSDYVVHEAAHVFHNTKRRVVGLREAKRQEWLLPIEFRKRETFAYACEAYSRIRERAKRPEDRLVLFEELRESPPPADERVDLVEYYDVLSDAVAWRNGWKVILERCAAQH